MKKAEYRSTCSMHFGLGFEYYCHFTSPIRRYPDLYIHRVISQVLKDDYSKKNLKGKEADAADAAESSSKMERRAMEAEREIEALKKTQFMLDKIGQEFDGIISGVTSNVLFVELKNTVEGVIPLSTITDDYYVYMEKQYCVIGEHTKRKFSLGDQMRIRVKDVDVHARRVEFELVE